MSVGLRNEATLALKITLENSKGVSSVKKELEALSNVFKASAFAKQANAMTAAMNKMQSDIKRLNGEIKKMQSSSASSSKQAAAQVNNHVLAWKSLERQFKANRAQADSHVKAFKALQAYMKSGTSQANAHVLAYKALEARMKATRVQMDAHVKVYRAQQAQQQAAATATRNHAYTIDVLKRSMSASNGFAIKNMAAVLRLNQAIKTGSPEALRLAKALDLAMTKTIGFNRALNRASFVVKNQFTGSLKATMGTMQQLRENFSEYEHRMDALFRAAMRLSMTGMTLRRWGENIIRVGAGIMDTFGEFEYTMLRAAGALEIWAPSINDTEVQFHDLQEAILDTAKDLKLFAAEEVAQALYFWGSATGQVVDRAEDLGVAMSGLDAIMRAAVMTNTDYETTIKGVYSILTQFYGGALKEADKVTEKLFFTTQKTAAEFTDLIQAFKMVGPVAAQVGASFDEVNESFGTLADLGLRGSMAGRGLRQMFIQLARPSGPAQKAIDALWNSLSPDITGGKSFIEVMFPQGEFIGITNYMRKLAEATMDLTSQERLSFLAKISTANMLPLMTALVNKQRQEILGLVDAHDKWRDADQKYVEFFENNWLALGNSWKAIMGSFQRSVESLQITLGEMLAGVLAPLIESLRVFISQLEEFVKKNPDIARFAQQLAVIAAVGLVVSGVVLTMLGAFIGLAASIYLVWQSTNQWILQITGFIAILGGLAAAIARNWDEIGRKLEPAINDLVEAFNNLTDGGEEVVSIFESIVGPIQEVFDRIVLLAADIVAGVAAMVRAFSELPFSTEIVKALGAVIGVLIASRVAVGMARVALAVTGVAKAIGLMVNAAKGAAGVKALLFAIGGGLPGIIAAASIGVLAFADHIGLLGEKQSEAASRVEQLTDALGDQGAAFTELAEQSVGYDDIIKRITEDAKIAHAALQAAKDVEVAPQSNEALIMSMDLSMAVAKSEVDLAGVEKDAEKQANTIRDRVLNIWTIVFNKMNDRFAGKGLSSLPEIGWAETLQEVFTAGITDPTEMAKAAALIVKTIKYRGSFSEEDMPNIYSAIAAMFPQISPAELRDMGIVDSMIGDISSGDSLISDDFYNQLVAAAEFDDAQLDKFMTTVVEGFDLIPAELVNDPRLSRQANEQLKWLLSTWNTDLAQQLEEMDTTLMAERITNAIKSTISQTFINALGPEALDLTEVIESATLLGGTEDLHKIVTELTKDLGDGRTWISEIEAGNVPDEMATAIKSAMQYLADNGMATEGMLAILEKAASTSGKTAGDTAKEHWVTGFTEAFSAKLDAAELKKLAKMGTIHKQVANGFKNIGKFIDAAWSGGGSRQSRRAFMEWWNARLDETELWIAEADKPAQQKRRAMTAAEALIPKMDKLPPQARDAAFDSLVNFGSIDPEKIGRKILKQFPKGSSIRNRLYERLFPKEKEGEGGGNEMMNAIADTITSGKGVVDSALAGVISFLSSEESLSVIAELETAKQIGDKLVDETAATIPLSHNQGKMTTSMNTLMSNSSNGVSISEAWNIGWEWAEKVADGIEAASHLISNAMKEATDDGRGESPPRSGPLRHIDREGFNVGSAWAKGYVKGVNSHNPFRDIRAFSGVDVVSKHKREVTVKLEVSSPDGTVNRQRQAEVRRGAMEALTAAGLEHYVTIT